MPLTVRHDEFKTHNIGLDSKGFISTKVPDLLDIVSAHATENETLCRLCPSVLNEMRDGALFRALQPRRFGGKEADVKAFFDQQIEIAASDMSSGWLFGVMGVLAFHLALFPDEAQSDVWESNSDALMACSYMQTGKAVAVSGGYELTGAWRFASGADYADWFMLGARIERDGAHEPVIFLVPGVDVTIRRTWQPAGLRGTGSQDLAIERCFVPSHRMHGIRERFLGKSPGLDYNRGALYRIPLPQLLLRVVSVPAIGALRGGLSALIDHNKIRVDIGGQRVAANSAVQLTVGEVAADIEEMIAVLHNALRQLSDAAAEGRDLPLQTRMIFRLQASRMADRCCRLMHQVFIAAGASGLTSDAPFGRILADIQASRQHIANQFQQFGQTLGASLLGIEIEDSLL
jgi:3-hydroxy-9,10-secoandrosta-1,3,5(10)-triene-9,17-dione monooxygenase